MNLAIIMRGVVGSGKSTLANKIKGEAWEHDAKVAIHSTDYLHYIHGEYVFQQEKLKEFHEDNFNAFKESLSTSDIVICDNTNIMPFEYGRYIEAAHYEGYNVTSVVFVPDELDVHLGRNKHGVPEKIVKKMIDGLNGNLRTIGVDFGYIVEPVSKVGFVNCLNALTREILK